jgi:CRISPR-associated protein Cas2
LARREGVALQYSGFVVNGDAAHIESLIQKLAVLIDPKLDDIRAYHLPARCQVWSLGRQSWPADICLTGQGALSVLLNATHDTAEGHEIT